MLALRQQLKEDSHNDQQSEQTELNPWLPAIDARYGVKHTSYTLTAVEPQYKRRTTESEQTPENLPLRHLLTITRAYCAPVAQPFSAADLTVIPLGIMSADGSARVRSTSRRCGDRAGRRHRAPHGRGLQRRHHRPDGRRAVEQRHTSRAADRSRRRCEGARARMPRESGLARRPNRRHA